MSSHSATATRTLVARDPDTFRVYRLGFSKAWDEHTDPATSAAHLAHAATTIGREWIRKYSVPFPGSRIEWTLEISTDHQPA